MKNRIVFDAKTSRTLDENGFMHVGLSNLSKETVNPYWGYEIPNFEALGLDAETTYQGYRKGEELEKAVPTFQGLPLLRGHYEESAEHPQKEHRVGSLGTECVYNSPYLQNTLIITDAEAIRKIENGERVELSCGYMYDAVLEKGEFESKPYDFIMTNIRGNHVALVEEGRAGRDVMVADSAQNITGKKPKKGKFMSKFTKKMKQAFDALIAKAKDEGTGENVEALENTVKQVLGEVEALEENLMDAGDMEKDAMPKDAADADKAEDADMPADAEKAEDADKAEDATCDVEFDPNNPEHKKLWAEAVRYGEKLIKNPAEREKLDGEHESEGAKKAMDAKFRMAFDAEAIKKSAVQEMRTQMKATLAAVQEVRPLVGVMDAMAFDNAQEVYKKACELRGVPCSSASAKEVAKALLLTAYGENRNSSSMAKDSANFTSRFEQKEQK